MYEGQAGWLLLIFFEDEDGGVGAITGEGGDFADGIFVAMVVGGAGDIDAVGEEGGEEASFVVESGVEGCGDEGFRLRRGVGGEEGGKAGGEGGGREIEICAGGGVGGTCCAFCSRFSTGGRRWWCCGGLVRVAGRINHAVVVVLRDRRLRDLFFLVASIFDM